MEALWGTEHTARVGAGDETRRAGMAAITGIFSKYKNQSLSLELALPHHMSLLSQQEAVMSERLRVVQPWGIMFVTKASQA